MEYGTKLNPNRSLRIAKGIKGKKQKVIVTHNPSEIDQNQLLLVRFPNLGYDDVIVPGTTNLSFDIELSSKVDKKMTLVDNIGRAIVRRLAVKFEGNEILSIDDYDIYACYQDLWKTKSEIRNAVRQGIVTDHGNTENCMKIRINASDKDTTKDADNAVAETYKNKFIIPLDFEMLDSTIPYYQAGLGNRLCYEITFNDYTRVIKSSPDKSGTTIPTPDANYEISNISLEYEIVTQPSLANRVRSQYMEMALLYSRVLRHRRIMVDKSDTTWNWNFNTPMKSLKGVLVIFEEESDYKRDTSKFYNPKINKVTIIVEGKPNQLFSQGMLPFEHYEEISKYFSEGKQKDNSAGKIQKLLQLSDVKVVDYLTTKYALWLDFRTIDENDLHGTGRRIDNASEGITVQIEKKEENAGKLNAYIYLIMDAQLNIHDGEYVSALY